MVRFGIVQVLSGRRISDMSSNLFVYKDVDIYIHELIVEFCPAWSVSHHGVPCDMRLHTLHL